MRVLCLKLAIRISEAEACSNQHDDHGPGNSTQSHPAMVCLRRRLGWYSDCTRGERSSLIQRGNCSSDSATGRTGCPYPQSPRRVLHFDLAHVGKEAQKYFLQCRCEFRLGNRSVLNW